MPADTLRIVLAQLNLLVGDIPGNAARLVQAAEAARDRHQADVILFPELSLTGYPPEDLLLRPSLGGRIDEAVARLKTVSGITLVFGLPTPGEGGLLNAAWALRDGQVLVRYGKQELPNNQVFDERRYFVPGHQAAVFEQNGVRLGLTICEDIWHPGPALAARDAGAELLLNLNASPFHAGKSAERHQVVASRCAETGLPVAYCNLVGGQDELIFDGGSFALQADGALALQAPVFEESLQVLDYDIAGRRFLPGVQAALPALEASVYQALVLAVRDYVNKSGFKGVVLGLSGGIDSALTLAIAVDALGAERVRAVMMPYRYTAEMSLEDAEAEARTLGVHYSVLSIAPDRKSVV